MSKLTGTSAAIVVSADGSGNNVVPPSVVQTYILDDFERTTAPSSSAGFGLASCGANWSNAGNAGTVTPGTHNISCDGHNGVIAIVGGGGIGGNSWLTSLPIPVGFQQSGSAREITFDFYWELTTQPSHADAQPLISFSWHGTYDTTPYATWALPSGVDGNSTFGGEALIYYSNAFSGFIIDPRSNGSAIGDTTIGPTLTTGLSYVTEIAISDAAGTIWFRVGPVGGPWSGAISAPLSVYGPPNAGPIDGVSVGCAVSNAGTPALTLSLQEIDVTF